MKYWQYLESEHWLKRRKLALLYAGCRCQVCNKTRKLNVHHNTYENLWAEKDRDLVVLCGKCHELFHGKLPPISDAEKEDIWQFLARKYFDNFNLPDDQFRSWLMTLPEEMQIELMASMKRKKASG